MNTIFNQVADIIKYCEHISPDIKINTSNLESTWSYNKKFWIDLLPNYIAELPEPITINLTSEDKQQLYNKFLSHNLFDTYEDLLEFLTSISANDFFNKYLEKEYDFYLDYCNEWIKIPKGTKIIKAFKFFHLQENDLKELQSEASRILQLDSITGKLCISVHPLDFLSASENISNWRSCHSLDGCYKAGNLSYMLDESTIMVYLRSDIDVQLPNFPEGLLWNNKKWRMFLHFDNQHNIVFTSQQYPFSIENIYDHITRLLNAVMYPTEYCFTKFCNDFVYQTISKKYLTHKLIPLSNCAKRINCLVKQHNWNLAYTDLLFKDSLKYKWAYKHMRLDDTFSQIIPNDTFGFDEYLTSNSGFYTGYTNDKTGITLGYGVKCPFCNKNMLTDGSSMVCEDCEKELFSADELSERRKDR